MKRKHHLTRNDRNLLRVGAVMSAGFGGYYALTGGSVVSYIAAFVLTLLSLHIIGVLEDGEV